MSTFSKENTNEIFEDIKRNLSRGVKDRKHDFHTPVFSNINNHNSIESRVVVLRDFDVENMILNFHTDFRSPKVEDLAKNENSLFVFYDYIPRPRHPILGRSLNGGFQSETNGLEPSTPVGPLRCSSCWQDCRIHWSTGLLDGEGPRC